MGISSLDDKNDNELPLAIGGLTHGVSPLEMAAAYGTIANDLSIYNTNILHKSNRLKWKCSVNTKTRTNKSIFRTSSIFNKINNRRTSKKVEEQQHIVTLQE